MIMQWSIERTIDGKVVSKEEKFMSDAFKKLIVAKDDTRGAARLSLGYGQATEFAREKYNIQVTLTCDQNKEMIEAAFDLGVETLKDLSEKIEKELAQ